MYAVLLHEISNVNVVQIVQFAEVHTVLHSPPVSSRYFAADSWKSRCGAAQSGAEGEDVYDISSLSSSVHNIGYGLNGYTLFIQLLEGTMQRSNNVTSHHLCSKVVMSGSKRNQTVK